MTDLELLELAAKAAGLNVKAERVDADDKFTNLIVGAKNTRERIAWNPLTDDGDALRLAVKLGMSIEVHYDESKPTPGLRVVFAGGRWEHTMVEEYARDPYAATRRAILRAAAEVGKAVP